MGWLGAQKQKTRIARGKEWYVLPWLLVEVTTHRLPHLREGVTLHQDGALLMRCNRSPRTEPDNGVNTW